MEGLSTFIENAVDGSCAYVHLSGYGIIRCPLDKPQLTPISKENTPVFLEESAGVQMLHQSPKGTYLLTWQRWYEEKPNNLKLWEASTGKLLAGFPQKSLRREGWPYLQLTADEKFAFLLCTNEIRVYTEDSFRQSETRFIEKLRVPGIVTLSLPSASAKGDYLFTTFCSADKNKPARAGLHQYVPNAPPSKNPTYPALLSKSLFQAEEMKTHWNPLGDTALITMQTSVDASGQSYYGSSQLFLFAQQLPDVQAVPLPQEGTVHDVGWLPDPDKPPCFVAIAGKMPAMTSLHHGQTGKAMFIYGNAHRNTVSWSPHGRFLCLAGFGNLAGEMSFWDKNKAKLIPGALNAAGELRAEAVVGYQWAPNSRVFAVSTCTPRMNVDNGARLFRYNGDELTNVPWDNENYKPNKLLGATFVPPGKVKYPDRPQTPPPEGQAAATPTASNPPVPPKPVGKYVPPGARNREGGTSLAERMRREKEGFLQGATRVSDKPQIVKNMSGKVIPGLVTEQPKSKSALKREKAKLKKQQQEEEERKKKDLEAQLGAAASKAPQAAPEEGNDTDREKRGRKLKKMLKQIEGLKEKDPATLNDDQKAKLASEAEVRQELEDLNL